MYIFWWENSCPLALELHSTKDPLFFISVFPLWWYTLSHDTDALLWGWIQTVSIFSLHFFSESKSNFQQFIYSVTSNSQKMQSCFSCFGPLSWAYILTLANWDSITAFSLDLLPFCSWFIFTCSLSLDLDFYFYTLDWAPSSATLTPYTQLCTLFSCINGSYACFLSFVLTTPLPQVMIVLPIIIIISFPSTSLEVTNSEDHSPCVCNSLKFPPWNSPQKLAFRKHLGLLPLSLFFFFFFNIRLPALTSYCRKWSVTHSTPYFEQLIPQITICVLLWTNDVVQLSMGVEVRIMSLVRMFSS